MDIKIAGGGLVGSIAACVFAQRGFHVELFEYRDDPLTVEKTIVPGQSINMALSTRGREALRRIGLEDFVLEHSVPMKGRLIHSIDGSTKENLYDPSGNEAIWSISRQFLNDILIAEARSKANVKIRFNQKVQSADLDSSYFITRDMKNKLDMKVEGDLIIGADGAYSAIRRSFLKKPLFNFNQTYIDTGYKELTIQSLPNGDYAMQKNFLHIWPRDRFMLIALPNQDGSFTSTLFMPFEIFKSFSKGDDVIKFFEDQFPDALKLIGKEKLVNDFFTSKTCPLISVQCSPLHCGKTVLIGDAAHAMVPFYGQGMNAGFEDVLMLDDIFAKFKLVPTCNDIEKGLEYFTEKRSKDAQAICELAMYNYLEMRHLVNKKAYFLRRNADVFLHKIFGEKWMPLYNAVTFSRTPYSQCILHRRWQDDMLNRVGQYISYTVTGLFLVSTLYIGKALNGEFPLPFSF